MLRRLHVVSFIVLPLFSCLTWAEIGPRPQIVSLDSNGITIEQLPERMLALQISARAAELIPVQPRLVSLPHADVNPNFRPKRIENLPAVHQTLLLIDAAVAVAGNVPVASIETEWTTTIGAELSKLVPRKVFPLQLGERQYKVVVACDDRMLREDGWPVGTRDGSNGLWFSQDFSVPCELWLESSVGKQVFLRHTYTYRDVGRWSAFALNWDLLWSGDIDRDGELDLIWRFTDESTRTWELWLSSRRDQQALVGKYATFVTYLPQDCSDKQCDD